MATARHEDDGLGKHRKHGFLFRAGKQPTNHRLNPGTSERDGVDGVRQFLASSCRALVDFRDQRLTKFSVGSFGALHEAPRPCRIDQIGVARAEIAVNFRFDFVFGQAVILPRYAFEIGTSLEKTMPNHQSIFKLASCI